MAKRKLADRAGRRRMMARTAWVDVSNPDVLDVCIPYQATTRHSWQGEVDPTTQCWEFVASKGMGAGDCSAGVDEAPGGASWDLRVRPSKRTRKPYTASVHFWPSETRKRPVTVLDKRYKGLAEALEAAKIAYNVCISKAGRGGMPKTRSYPGLKKR